MTDRSPLYIFETSDSLLRLLNLSGQRRLDEKLTPQQAAAVFVNHGAEVDSLDNPEYLRSFRIQVNKRNHPDAGGDGRAAAEVNAAYDVIKGGFRGTPHAGPTPTHTDTDARQGGRDWMDTKMYGDPADRNPSPKKNWPGARNQWMAPRQGETTRLYVWTGTGLEHLDDVTGDTDAIRASLMQMVKYGDITSTESVLAVRPGWESTVAVLMSHDIFHGLNPPTIQWGGPENGDLAQDHAWIKGLPQIMKAVLRYTAWHSHPERR